MSKKRTVVIFIRLLILVILTSSCNNTQQKTTENPNTETVSKIELLITNLKDSNNKEIIVVAHRGDWRNAPENSLQAIQNCIDMGVDMVEIDVRETKDGHLVLMHDNSIERTTTGKGLVKEWTLDSLKTLKLLPTLLPSTNQKV